MIEIRNLLFQPLTFQLAGEEHGLHVGPRQTKTIEDDRLSQEIEAAGKRGFVSIGTVETPPEEFDPETMMSAPADPDADGTQTEITTDESPTDLTTDVSMDAEAAPATDAPTADAEPTAETTSPEEPLVTEQPTAETTEPVVETMNSEEAAIPEPAGDFVQMAALSVSDDAVVTTTRKRR